MPELPEVQTTVNGLRKHIIGLIITDVWTNYNSPYFKGSETIKDPAYFKHFKKEILERKVLSVERRAKNILINLSATKYDTGKVLGNSSNKTADRIGNVSGNNVGKIGGGIGNYAGAGIPKTLLVHMKMTGHLLYGLYEFMPKKHPADPWQPIEPEGLKDPFNKRVRFVITFSNGRHLALSDTRKFAKVAVVDTHIIHDSVHLNELGPEPLDKSFTFEKFAKLLEVRPQGKIKQVLTNQTVLSGIGNIYADESLWRAGIHPLSIVGTIPVQKLRELYSAIKLTLSRGIDLGGDSMSDYRNILGNKGNFQEQHHAYQKTGEKCDKRGCKGTIVRIVVGGRATHYCEAHQKI